jgi:hypothetical protein
MKQQTGKVCFFPLSPRLKSTMQNLVQQCKNIQKKELKMHDINDTTKRVYEKFSEKSNK